MDGMDEFIVVDSVCRGLDNCMYYPLYTHYSCPVHLVPLSQRYMLPHKNILISSKNTWTKHILDRIPRTPHLLQSLVTQFPFLDHSPRLFHFLWTHLIRHEVKS